MTSTAIRSVKVDAYASLVREELGALEGGFLIMRRSEGSTWTKWSGVPGDAWASLELSHRKRRDPDEVLPVVARVYRDALMSADPAIAGAPTRYVAEQLSYSRAHAGRLVANARKAGLLAPALPGRAGEVVTEPDDEEVK